MLSMLRRRISTKLKWFSYSAFWLDYHSYVEQTRPALKKQQKVAMLRVKTFFTQTDGADDFISVHWSGLYTSGV